MTVGPLSVREPLEDYADCHATPRALYFGDRMLTLLTVSEGRRVEAQLLGSGLRIVDAAGNLPAWPDLAALRGIVDRAELLALGERNDDEAYEDWQQWTGLAFEALYAAIELIHDTAAAPITRNED